MTFQEWFLEICKSESPDRAIIAFNFGLFETEDGYTVYLIGSSEYDQDNPDWAVKNDFEPAKKYFPLPSEEFKKLGWEEVLDRVRIQLDEFINTKVFRASFLAAAEAITTGFDDGDLILIRQIVNNA